MARILSLVFLAALVTLAIAAPDAAAPAKVGTVKGAVRYAGKPPKLAALKPSKDPQACGKSLPDETLLVSAKGGLANAVVSLDGVPGPAAKPAPVTLNQVSCRYLPHVQGAVAGSDLVLMNGDAVLHNVHAYKEDDTAFNVALPIKGARSKEKLEGAGHYLLKCDAGHTWMSAHVMVFEHRYYAVTDKEGQFSIAGVPPGKYPVKVWHEKLGALSGTADVTAGGTASVTLTYKGK